MVHVPYNEEVLFTPVIYELFYYGSIYPILHCESVFPPFLLYRSRCRNLESRGHKPLLEFLSSVCWNKPNLKPQVCVKRLGPSYDWCQPTRNSSHSKWVAVLWIWFIIINRIDIIMMMIIQFIFIYMMMSIQLWWSSDLLTYLEWDSSIYPFKIRFQRPSDWGKVRKLPQSPPAFIYYNYYMCVCVFFHWLNQFKNWMKMP